jgi:hypothetical protein
MDESRMAKAVFVTLELVAALTIPSGHNLHLITRSLPPGSEADVQRPYIAFQLTWENRITSSAE